MSSMLWSVNATELDDVPSACLRSVISPYATSWVFIKSRSDAGTEDQGPKSEKNVSNRFGSNVDCKGCGWKIFGTSVVEKSGISNTGVLGSAVVYWQEIPRVWHREQLGRFKLHLALSDAH